MKPMTARKKCSEVNVETFLQAKSKPWYWNSTDKVLYLFVFQWGMEKWMRRIQKIRKLLISNKYQKLQVIKLDQDKTHNGLDDHVDVVTTTYFKNWKRLDDWGNLVEMSAEELDYMVRHWLFAQKSSTVLKNKVQQSIVQRGRTCRSTFALTTHYPDW